MMEQAASSSTKCGGVGKDKESRGSGLSACCVFSWMVMGKLLHQAASVSPSTSWRRHDSPPVLRPVRCSVFTAGPKVFTQ